MSRTYRCVKAHINYSYYRSGFAFSPHSVHAYMRLHRFKQHMMRNLSLTDDIDQIHTLFSDRDGGRCESNYQRRQNKSYRIWSKQRLDASLVVGDLDLVDIPVQNHVVKRHNYFNLSF